MYINKGFGFITPFSILMYCLLEYSPYKVQCALKVCTLFYNSVEHAQSVFIVVVITFTLVLGVAVLAVLHLLLLLYT